MKAGIVMMELIKEFNGWPRKIEFLGDNFKLLNNIYETENHFVINNIPWGKSKILRLFGEQDLMSVNEQYGDLWITNLEEWKLRCSDPEYCGFTSCFRPNGEKYWSCQQYAKSPNVFMAMILSKDKKKIIGRRFIIVPYRSIPDNNGNYSYLEIALFLKTYGVWPKMYDNVLVNYVKKMFNLSMFNGQDFDNYIRRLKNSVPRKDDLWIDTPSFAYVGNNFNEQEQPLFL